MLATKKVHKVRTHTYMSNMKGCNSKCEASICAIQPIMTTPFDKKEKPFLLVLVKQKVIDQAFQDT